MCFDKQVLFTLFVVLVKIDLLNTVASYKEISFPNLKICLIGGIHRTIVMYHELQNCSISRIW